MSPTLVIADEFLQKLHEAGILDNYDTVQRVILDFKVGDVGRMYVQRLTDTRFADVLLHGGLQITEDESKAVVHG